MNAAADLSILSLLTKATLVVQIVMAILVLVSLASWTAIFSKWFAIRRARAQTEGFERSFWSGAELNQLYQQASNSRLQTGALERIFEAGMSEFLKLRGRGDAGASVAVLTQATLTRPSASSSAPRQACCTNSSEAPPCLSTCASTVSASSSRAERR